MEWWSCLLASTILVALIFQMLQNGMDTLLEVGVSLANLSGNMKHVSSSLWCSLIPHVGLWAAIRLPHWDDISHPHTSQASGASVQYETPWRTAYSSPAILSPNNEIQLHDLPHTRQRSDHSWHLLQSPHNSSLWVRSNLPKGSRLPSWCSGGEFVSNWVTAGKEEIKDSLVTSPVLAPFHPNLEIVVSADACSYGLGAVHLQWQLSGELKPVAYVSRLITPTEIPR